MLGESPWASPYKVWAEKTAGRSHDDGEVNEAAEWGLAFERTIAERFAARYRRRVILPPPNTWQLYVHGIWPYMRATPDALQYARHDESELPEDEPGVLQIKCADASKRREWRNGVPLHYEIQTQYEMAVCGVSWGSLVVLLGGNTLLGPFDLIRNDSFLDVLQPFLARFWQSISLRIPPEIDGSEATAAAIAALYEEAPGKTIELSAAAWQAGNELRTVNEKLKTLKEQKRLLENRIKAEMGDAAIGLLPSGGFYSLRTVTPSPYTAAPKPYRRLWRHR